MVSMDSHDGFIVKDCFECGEEPVGIHVENENDPLNRLLVGVCPTCRASEEEDLTQDRRYFVNKRSRVSLEDIRERVGIANYAANNDPETAWPAHYAREVSALVDEIDHLRERLRREGEDGDG